MSVADAIRQAEKYAQIKPNPAEIRKSAPNPVKQIASGSKL
jgi:hypothetical protein